MFGLVYEGYGWLNKENAVGFCYDCLLKLLNIVANFGYCC